jgi:hypothetical protein
MKISLVLLVLLACSNISKSEVLIFHSSTLNGCIDSIPVKNKITVQKKIKTNTPFQGKRTFCSSGSDARYAYRKFAPKNNYGKFYVITTDHFNVLNPENGEYMYFASCK